MHGTTSLNFKVKFVVTVCDHPTSNTQFIQKVKKGKQVSTGYEAALTYFGALSSYLPGDPAENHQHLVNMTT